MPCPECGNAVPAVPIGRPRRFCSTLCTDRWHRESKRLERARLSLLARADEAEHLAKGLTAYSWMRGAHDTKLEMARVWRDRAREIAETLAARRVAAPGERTR